MCEANSLLAEVYKKNGIEFQYPDFWELMEEKTENELTISINSPDTSFWSLTLIDDGVEPNEVINTAEETFQAEYDDIEAESVEDRISHRDCVARDLNFSCQDLINSVFLRAFRTGQFTVFIYYQATDHELKESLPLLKGISSSLRCAGDETIFED